MAEAGALPCLADVCACLFWRADMGLLALTALHDKLPGLMLYSVALTCKRACSGAQTWACWT